jgi:quinol monooxygenase YgiN
MIGAGFYSQKQRGGGAMNRLLGLVMLGVAISMMATHAAQAQDAGAYTVSYIEVSHTAIARAAALLKGLAKEARNMDGNLRFEVLQRRDRSNQFAILEAWKDKAAHDAHLAAGHTRDFRDKLAPMLITGYDERPHAGLAAGPVNAGAGSRGAAVTVVTHVDVVPPKKDEAIAALKQLSEPSRGEAGNLRFEALQQVSRPNHSTLIEIWKDQRALEAHEMAAHTKAFREQISPMSGALYDQRLYKALN